MNKEPMDAGLVRYRIFIEQLGISRVTGHRYRHRKWVNTVNIAGVPYISREEIENFKRRAESGEFARTWTRGKGAE